MLFTNNIEEIRAILQEKFGSDAENMRFDVDMTLESACELIRNKNKK